MDRLDEIHARCEAATPGPWKYIDNGFDGMIKSEEETICGGEPCEGRIEDGPDAQFIAHARDDIPYLLDRAEKAEADRDTYRAALQLLELMISGEREGNKEREHSVGVVIAVNRARELMKGE